MLIFTDSVIWIFGFSPFFLTIFRLLIFLLFSAVMHRKMRMPGQYLQSMNFTGKNFHINPWFSGCYEIVSHPSFTQRVFFYSARQMPMLATLHCSYSCLLFLFLFVVHFYQFVILNKKKIIVAKVWSWGREQGCGPGGAHDLCFHTWGNFSFSFLQLGFGPWADTWAMGLVLGRDLGFVAGIWALRLEFGPWGWNFCLEDKI